MRLPGIRQDCGALLQLGWVTRQLRLSRPIDDGSETIHRATAKMPLEGATDSVVHWRS